jgi:hypothetical protein
VEYADGGVPPRKGLDPLGCHGGHSYVQPMNFLAPGSRDMFDANNKVVDYLFRALCQPESDRLHTGSLACRIWSVLKEAHVGNA